MAFPCNQFGRQEPGSPNDIKAFAEGYGVEVNKDTSNFHLMHKVDVNGKGTSPVYNFLKKHAGSGDIRWNFHTKFIVQCNDAKDTCDITRHDNVGCVKALEKAGLPDLDLGGGKKRKRAEEM